MIQKYIWGPSYVEDYVIFDQTADIKGEHGDCWGGSKSYPKACYHGSEFGSDWGSVWPRCWGNCNGWKGLHPSSTLANVASGLTTWVWQKVEIWSRKGEKTSVACIVANAMDPGFEEIYTFFFSQIFIKTVHWKKSRFFCDLIIASRHFIWQNTNIKKFRCSLYWPLVRFRLKVAMSMKICAIASNFFWRDSSVGQSSSLVAKTEKIVDLRNWPLRKRACALRISVVKPKIPCKSNTHCTEEL